MKSLFADHGAALKRVASHAGTLSARLIFPPTCFGCRRIVMEPGTFCAACWPQIRFLEQPWCAILGVPFDHDFGPGTVSPAAIANPPAFDAARAAVSYDGVARRMAQGLKYGDRTDLAPWMARWMKRAGQEFLDEVELVIPVPLHRRRFLVRRFNQSAELARSLCRFAGLAYHPQGVRRIKPTLQQVGLNSRQRADNVRSAFVVPDRFRSDMSGRTILIVDDVYTTGATVQAMARCLRKAGAARIFVLTFARVLTEDFRHGGQAPIYPENHSKDGPGHG